MPYTYEPEIEEDQGYSIPKILVAVLLLIMIGAGIYIYFQQRKLKASIGMLKDSKKLVERDLNEMIARYDLAIDSNDDLAGDLEEERDAIISFRDSIKQIKAKDFGKAADYKDQLMKLRKSSALVYERDPVTTPTYSSIPEVTIKETTPTTKIVPKKSTKTESFNTDTTKGVVKEEDLEIKKEDTATKTKIALTEKKSEVTKENDKKEAKDAPTPKKKEELVSFNTVEIPPTYPGCRGNTISKKACFNKKIKSHIAKRFNSEIVSDIGLPAGKKKIWVNFVIDKYGQVSNVRARGPHKKLEKEGIRVIKQLPKMTPARQSGNTIGIHYSVPITVISE